MFPTINAEYTAAKRADADNALILESVLGEDETLPGSDEEFEEIVDPDSVPADVYARIDKELDRIVGDPSYDDTEAEEMLDDDFDVDDISDAEIDAIMDEAITRMERSEKIAGIVANLSEKAGMNAMARESGMGLLKVLSESVQQFHNGKMEDPIGQAYEPVSTPDKSIDETELENEALKESVVNQALARFHAIMEEANPDVEDFPGRSGTARAYGDTPAGMPEPNGNEDGSNVGGDDQVVDREAREVEVEDGGDDVIKVIKANESVSSAIEKIKAVHQKADAEHQAREAARKKIRTSNTVAKKELEDEAPEKGLLAKYKHAQKVDARAHEIRREAREELRQHGGDPKYELPTRYDHKIDEATSDCAYGDKMNEAVNRYRAIVEKVCPKCGLPKDSKACKEQCTDEEREGINEAIKPGKVVGTAARTYGNAVLSGSVGSLAGGLVSLADKEVIANHKERDRIRRSADMTEDEKKAAIDKLNARDREIGDRYAAAGGRAGAVLGAARGLQKSIAKYRKTNETVTNPDVEDFPGQTGADNDHGEREGALPQGQEPADFPNSTGDKKVNSGNDPTSRYKAVAEATSAASGVDGIALIGGHGIIGNGIGDVAGDIGSRFGKANRAYHKLKQNRNATEKELEAAKKAADDERNKARKVGGAIGGAAGAVYGYKRARKLSESITNPDVEDFPGREGTDSAEGNAAPRGMKHCDDSCQPAYEDQSDYEQREVGVEDGGTDAINVIKANENCRMIVEAARARANA